MLSQKAKVLQKLASKTMLQHILTSANQVSDKMSVVVGFDKEGVEEEISRLSINAKTYLQKKQMSGLKKWKRIEFHVVQSLI